jgi:hypothetical protein
MKTFKLTLALLLAGNASAIEAYQNVVKVDLTKRSALNHHVDFDTTN